MNPEPGSTQPEDESVRMDSKAPLLEDQATDRYARLEELRRSLGTVELHLTPEELARLRGKG